MALTFPSNPTNGQVYDQYIYSSTSQSWRVYGSDTGMTNVLATKANLSGGNTFSGNQNFSGYMVNSNNPAFHAYGNQVGTTTYSANATIAFENTRYNVGNNYNTSTSRFTAPVAGMYMFWFEAFNQSGAEQRVAFKINGDVGSQIFGQGQTSGATAYRQTVSVKLSAGDYISVLVAYNSTSIYKWTFHNEWGGCLLFAV